ncbi:response regulator [Pseudomonas sp. NPDC078700]|uniref:response regulator n=1 Tax=Pseudomonas sp. NPDC078700 TaxID=3364424 RepID=UPI0037CBF0F4
MNNRILVVEDEYVLAQNFKDYLEMMGHEVLVADDGLSAISFARLYEPAAIVLDFRLPDMEGFGVLDAMGHGWGCKCVLITAQPVAEVSAKAQQHGIEQILFKPFPLKDLGRAVRTLINASLTSPR